MADLVIASQSPTSCSHFVIDGLEDGTTAWSTVVTDAELQEPLTAAERIQLRRLLMRRLRQTGVTLSQFVNRVVRGEEAINMRTYTLIGPGVSITKTNIGTAYVNISPRLNGERRLVSFVGCTQYRLIASVNLVGTGQWGMRVVRDSDDAVLHENANLGAAGERELDTNWQDLPAAAIGGEFLVRVQGKSTTGADDPVFGGVTLLVR